MRALRRNGCYVARVTTKDNVMLTTKDAARLLGISTSTLRRWCDKGIDVPHWRTPTGQRRFPARELRGWMEGRKPQ